MKKHPQDDPDDQDGLELPPDPEDDEFEEYEDDEFEDDEDEDFEDDEDEDDDEGGE